MGNTNNSDFEHIIYVFQGGGALGSYQAGVFQALTEHDYQPNWMIGTSIGAINASIVAGNQPKKRIEKLKQFWNAVTHDIFPAFKSKDEIIRRFYNSLSAQQSVMFGEANFFIPRIEDPLFAYDKTPDQISFYVVEPLKKLLTELIDFNLINRGDIRLTLGAVEIECGKTHYFDNHHDTISVDHILASCALPPGFPAVEIDGKYYWDGGVLSNAPMLALLNEPTNKKVLCILASLFDSFGLQPKTLDDVMKRHKDITYSSHFKAHMDIYKVIHGLRSTLYKYTNILPPEFRKNTNLQKALGLHDLCKPIHFVRFLYQAPNYELSSKDYEFSKLSMQERFDTGYQDAINAVKTSPWLDSATEQYGIGVHEFYQNLDKFMRMKE